MAVYEILPNKNLKVSDIRDTLNTNGGTTDNEFSSLFKAANHNMWSRFKPVPHSAFFLDGDGRWKGEDGRCGLTIPIYTSPSTIRTALVNGSAMWSYTPPNGTQRQPFRVGDFRGYNPHAVNPIGELFDEYILTSSGTGYEFDIQIEIVVGSQDGEYNLTLGDIEVNGVKLTDMYLGVYMIPKSGSGYFFGTSSSKIGTSDSLTMTLQGSSATQGEYTAYCFLSTTPQVNNEQSGEFISINKEGQKINIIVPSDLYQIEVYGVWNTAGTSFEYEVIVTNKNSTSVAFSNLKLYLVRSRDYDGMLNKDEQAESYTLASSVTIESNGTRRYTGQRSYTRSDDYYYGLYVGATTPALSTSVMPLEESADMPELFKLDTYEN